MDATKNGKDQLGGRLEPAMDLGLPDLEPSMMDQSPGRPRESLESILGPDLDDGRDATGHLEGISPDRTLDFDELSTPSTRPRKRKVPIWLVACLVVVVLGGAAFMLRDTILGLLPLGGSSDEGTVADLLEPSGRDQTDDLYGPASGGESATPADAGQGEPVAGPSGGDTQGSEVPEPRDQGTGSEEAAAGPVDEPAGPARDGAQGFGPGTGAAERVRDREPVEARDPQPPAPTAAPAGPLTRIVDVTWDQGPSGTTISLTGDGTFADGSFGVLPLDDPPRILVRVNGITDGYPRHELAVGSSEVATIRIGHHPENRPPQLFVVLDLTDDLSAVTDTRVDGRTLMIEISR
jgi:hypothetical protein